MNYKVVVIGAGPSGSTAAKFLAENGVKTALIDKSNFPREKVCGGGVTQRLFDRFDYINKNQIFVSESYGISLHSSSLKYNVIVEKDKPIITMVLRKNFDNELVKLAVKAGADFLSGKKVIDIEIQKDKIITILDDKTKIFSDIIIGADGIWSTVAKKTGLAKNQRFLAMCAMQEYDLNKNNLSEFFNEKRISHFHLEFRNIPGYGWVFPKKKHLNIGIIESVTRKKRLTIKTPITETYKYYFNYLKNEKMIPADLKIGRLKGGAVSVYPLEKTFSDRVILCGDAAGFANPISAEGIYYAMVSGKIAAEVCVKAVNSNNFSEKTLSLYQQKWKKDFGYEFEFFNRSSTGDQTKTERLVRIMDCDPKLAELGIDLMYSGCDIRRYKWKLLTRYLYASIKLALKNKSN